eukprot:3885256-Amphidinium_carterae.1
MALARQVANDPQLRQTAIQQLEEGFLARSSVRAKTTKRRQAEELAGLFLSPGQSIYPLEPTVIVGTAAALKAAGFRAAWSYVEELKLGHIESRYDVPLWLERVLAQCKRSVNRGLGPPDRAPELPLAELPDFNPELVHEAHGEPADAWTSYVVAFRWLLREIEVVALTVEDVSFDGDVVSLDVKLSKNDASGLGTKRKWKCTCRAGSLDEMACPYHVLERHLAKCGPCVPSDALFRTARGGTPLKEGMISAW